MSAKYPKIRVRGDLRGPEGTVFVSLGKIVTALRRNGVSQKDIDAFQKEATSSDYNHVLATCKQWVNFVT